MLQSYIGQCIREKEIKLITNLIKSAKGKYHRGLLNNNLTKINLFWKTIKRLYPTKVSTPGSSNGFQIDAAWCYNKDAEINNWLL